MATSDDKYKKMCTFLLTYILAQQSMMRLQDVRIDTLTEIIKTDLGYSDEVYARLTGEHSANVEENESFNRAMKDFLLLPEIAETALLKTCDIFSGAAGVGDGKERTVRKH